MSPWNIGISGLKVLRSHTQVLGSLENYCQTPCVATNLEMGKILGIIGAILRTVGVVVLKVLHIVGDIQAHE